MNFIGRAFTAVAVVLVEYTNQPVLFVLILAVFVCLAINGLI